MNEEDKVILFNIISMFFPDCDALFKSFTDNEKKIFYKTIKKYVELKDEKALKHLKDIDIIPENILKKIIKVYIVVTDYVNKLSTAQEELNLVEALNNIFKKYERNDVLLNVTAMVSTAKEIHKILNYKEA